MCVFASLTVSLSRAISCRISVIASSALPLQQITKSSAYDTIFAPSFLSRCFFFQPSTNRRIYKLASNGEATPLTQKITSSLSAGFRPGGSLRGLILDARSITLMSHGAIHASAKGAKAKRSLSAAGAADEHGGSGHVARARGGNFTAPCLSLPRSRRQTETTRSDRRTGAADYFQASRQCDSCPAQLCREARSDLERGCGARHHGVRGACSPSCLGDAARAMFVSNTPSIVCSPPSSSKSTKSSYPIVCG